MGLIKLSNGDVVKDRRINGSRIKLDLGDWLKIISMIVVVILGIGNIKWTVNNHSQLLASYGEEIKENGQITRDNRKDIENLKTTIERIDKNVRELLKK